VQSRRLDEEAVVRLSRGSAECGEHLSERGKPIGLMTAQVCDAAQSRGRLGECGKRGDDGCELADLAEVDVDAADRAGPGDGEGVGVQIDVPAHLGQQAAQVIARLGRVTGPAGDRHRARRRHGRGEEGAGVRQVGLDAAIDGADRGRRQSPGGGVGVEVDVHAVLAEHVECHGDMRLARQVAAGVREGEPIVEARGREDQTADELARC